MDIKVPTKQHTALKRSQSLCVSTNTLTYIHTVQYSVSQTLVEKRGIGTKRIRKKTTNQYVSLYV